MVWFLVDLVVDSMVYDGEMVKWQGDPGNEWYGDLTWKW